MTTYKPKTILFAGHDVEDAKKYVFLFNLTADDVRIIKRDDGVYVQTKREVTIATPPD